MNIQNITKEDIQKEFQTSGDMLTDIFKRQEELEKKYYEIEIKNGEALPSFPIDIDTFEGQRRARAIIYRITEELYEAGNCLRNKAWKNTHVPTDKDHFLEELADALHFMIQLFLELGLTSTQVYILYFKKSMVNLFRQKSNY